MQLITILSFFLSFSAAIIANPVITSSTSSSVQSINYVQNYNGNLANFKYNEGDGTYSGKWNHPGDFVVGLGWSTGTFDRKITFATQYQSDQSSYLAVYGWLSSPLTEYYVVEKYSQDPCSLDNTQIVGNVYSDNSQYNICKHTQVNQPSIQGTKTFGQFFSVRQGRRNSGMVTLSNHFTAWKKYGFAHGATNINFNYQVFATEAFGGTGSVNAKISG